MRHASLSQVSHLLPYGTVVHVVHLGTGGTGGIGGTGWDKVGRVHFRCPMCPRVSHASQSSQASHLYRGIKVGHWDRHDRTGNKNKKGYYEI